MLVIKISLFFIILVTYFLMTKTSRYRRRNMKLTAIPNDIPVDTTYISLNQNNITLIPPKFLMKYKKCKQFYINNNQITEIQSDTFAGGTVLIGLGLENNKICFLPNKVFRYLSKLDTLSLENNCIKEINQDTWFGLKSIDWMLLSGNNIQVIRNYTFRHVRYLSKLQLANNKIESISKDLCLYGSELTLDLSNNTRMLLETDFIHNFKHLDTLILNKNNISNIQLGTFHNLNYLFKLTLNDNSLTCIQRKTFLNLPDLCHLELSWNKISTIESGAFAGLTDLCSINLNGNKLTAIIPDLFEGSIMQRQKITLEFSQNLIQNISIGSFSFMNDEKNELIEININLSHNLLGTLSWMIFLDWSHDYTCHKSILGTRAVTLNMVGNNISCSRHHCWMKELNMENGTCSTQDNTNIVYDKCVTETSASCPKPGMCSNHCSVYEFRPERRYAR